jgi:hypothetical protein
VDGLHGSLCSHHDDVVIIRYCGGHLDRVVLRIIAEFGRFVRCGACRAKNKLKSSTEGAQRQQQIYSAPIR